MNETTCYRSVSLALLQHLATARQRPHSGGGFHFEEKSIEALIACAARTHIQPWSVIIVNVYDVSLCARTLIAQNSDLGSPGAALLGRMRRTAEFVLPSAVSVVRDFSFIS